MPPPKDPVRYEEWRKKQSESHKGQIPWMKGRVHTPEALLQQRIAKLGNTFRRGQTNTLEQNRKISLAKKGKPSSFKGKKHNAESNQKNREKHIGNKNKLGKKLNPESINKIKKARALQIFPLTDTKPERIVQIALSLNSITYKKHKMINSDGFYHQVDIFLEPNICIEIDGDYWHNLPKVIKRDEEINHNLHELGFNVYRFWESEVKKDVQPIIETIKNLI